MMAADLITDFGADATEYESGDFEHEPNFSVTHVYDIAQDIGKDFEKLIDRYGVESVRSIMPKVIGALEQLERLASQAEAAEETLTEFKAAIEQLEREKRQKAQDRLKYERDLEAIEDRLRAENQELANVIVKLQEENKRLNSTLRHSDSFHGLDRGIIEQHGLAETDTKSLEIIGKLQKQLDASDALITAKTVDLDSALSQIERLNGLNKDLKRKLKHSQASIRSTAEEKAEIQATMQMYKKELTTMATKLDANSRTNDSVAEMSDGVKAIGLAEVQTSATGTGASDPNVPRFSATELKTIIMERNELKNKVSDMSDIITALKRNETREGTSTYCDDDLPVQGPLPFEPDDAPWRKSDSGIRSFFKKLFGATEAPFSFLQ